MTPRLGAKFTEALGFAAELHRDQRRKADDIPYIGHLLSVAGLVIEAGGDETQAIAALLHDAAEDQGGVATLDEITTRFGIDVARIVRECSDTLRTPKPPWRPRKRSHIEHLGTAWQPTVLVSIADKLDNARSMSRDFRRVGSALWARFNEHDPQQHLWYYRSLLAVYRRRSDSWLVDEFARVVAELDHQIGAQNV